MERKKLIVSAIIAFIFSILWFVIAFLLTSLIASFIYSSFFYPEPVYHSIQHPVSLVVFFLFSITWGIPLFLLIKMLVRFEFGKDWKGLLISVLQIWLIMIIIFLIFDLFFEPVYKNVANIEKCLEQQKEAMEQGKSYISHCALGIWVILFDLVNYYTKFLLLSRNPLVFFLGAYIARKFLKW